MTERCGTCNAWMKEQGLCRAHAPVPIMVGMGQQSALLRQQQQVEPVIMSYFPSMAEHGWCREWQPKKADLQ
jgi:hypothetical protein